MVGHDFFVDASGFFALLCPADPAHRKAQHILKKAAVEKRLGVTSDYVLDETATLLVARRVPHLAAELFRMIEQSQALRVVFIHAERFEEARALFLKHLDQEYSFTDCTSFALMREMKNHDALTSDRHFRERGFNPLLV